MRIKHYTPLVLALLAMHICLGQDHDWWATNVGWDGNTHWSRYITYSPAMMGPNALPVPKLIGGQIAPKNFLEVTGNAHYTPGDHTYNPQLRLNLTFAKEVVALELVSIPIEYYEMSHAMKEERKIFYQFYEDKTAQGDLYLNGTFRLVNRSKFHLLFRSGYRFATGNKVGMARFTDSPGYNVDLNFDLPAGHRSRWLGMAGLVVWQTNQTKYFQDDAWLYGIGWEGQYENGWKLVAHLRGYWGYIDNGDRPVLTGIAINKMLNAAELNLAIQRGLHDYPFTSVQFGMKYQFRDLWSNEENE